MTDKQSSESSNSMEPDIHIQFPENYKAQQVEKLWPVGETKKTSDKEKDLLVILLGWAGAEHKYLSKYCDYYVKRGCIVLSYITPLRYHFVETRKLPELARKILKFITDLQLHSHPVFFHVFSNGGSFTYSYMLKELAKSHNPFQLDVKGTIFDSAPSPRRFQTTFRAILNIFSNFRLFKYVAALLVIFALICQVFWYHIRTAFNFCIHGDTLDSLNEKEDAPLTNWLGRIAKMRNHNFLFLYSDADDLILVDRVEGFADIAQARGNRVEKVKFHGSEHVMHYRRYPKEYGNAVTCFIRSSMMEDHGRTILYEE